MAEGRGLFELGGQWIDRIKGSPNLYRFWYVPGRREVCRRSLKTTDLEKAKAILVKVVGQGLKGGSKEPDRVMLAAVLTHYYESHSDALPSAGAARRAGELVLNFLSDVAELGDNVKCAAFTRGMQQRFAQWSAEQFDHSTAYISRNLSVISSAVQHAATPFVREVDGQLVEVQLLTTAPKIFYDGGWIAKITGQPEPGSRDYVPSYKDLASLLDFPTSDTIRRFDIMVLNTWSRPAALLDLNVKDQVDFEERLVDLNPPGRRQTKKHRPKLRLTRNLQAWLELWGDDRPLRKPVLDARGRIVDWEPVSYIKKHFERRTFRWMLTKLGFKHERILYLENEKRRGKPDAFWEAIRMAEDAGIRRITPYTIRHFMATRVRGLEEIKVDKEQRDIWRGHQKTDTSDWYEHFDPEYLQAAADATDLIIAKLDALTTRPLVPDTLKARMAAAGMTVVKDTPIK